MMDIEREYDSVVELTNKENGLFNDKISIVEDLLNKYYAKGSFYSVLELVKLIQDIQIQHDNQTKVIKELQQKILDHSLELM